MKTSLHCLALSHQSLNLMVRVCLCVEFMFWWCVIIYWLLFAIFNSSVCYMSVSMCVSSFLYVNACVYLSLCNHVLYKKRWLVIEYRQWSLSHKNTCNSWFAMYWCLSYLQAGVVDTSGHSDIALIQTLEVAVATKLCVGCSNSAIAWRQKLHYFSHIEYHPQVVKHSFALCPHQHVWVTTAEVL